MANPLLPAVAPALGLIVFGLNNQRKPVFCLFVSRLRRDQFVGVSFENEACICFAFYRAEQAPLSEGQRQRLVSLAAKLAERVLGWGPRP